MVVLAGVSPAMGSATAIEREKQEKEIGSATTMTLEKEIGNVMTTCRYSVSRGRRRFKVAPPL